MNKKTKVISAVGLTLICGSILGVNVTANEQITNNTKIDTARGEKSGENTLYGLMGKYYSDKTHKSLEFIAPSSGNTLKYNQEAVNEIPKHIGQKFQYIQWLGRIKPDSEGDFELKTSDDKNTIIKIDGKTVSSGTKKELVTLKKGETKKIEIIYTPESEISNESPELTDFKLYRVSKSNETTQFKEKELLNPTIDVERSQKAIDEYKKEHKKSPQHDWGDPDEDLDTDDDSIPDLWEEKTGYTIHRKVAVAWEDDMAEDGYTKFMSNSLNAHTSGDPYSDYEKAAKDMPEINDKSAYNPMVAAYPIVNVNLEKMILSVNQNLSNSIGSSTSDSASTTNTEDLSVNAGISKEQGLSFGVSAGYSHSNTSSKEWGTSNESSSSFNTAQAGYLNGNIRYNNTGTGAIYSLKPTISFSLDSDTLITTKAKENLMAESLRPGTSYPEKGQNGISINTSDDFNSHPITLNQTQLYDFTHNTRTMKIDTNQVSGLYATKNEDGTVSVAEGNNWAPIKDQIDSLTASFTIDDGNGMYERRVAAKDFSDPEDYTPVVTVKEALKMAYPDMVVEDSSGNLTFNGIPLNDSMVQIITDQTTEKLINKQVSTGTKSIYDIKLERKMNFTFKLPEQYISMSGNNGLKNDYFKAQKDYPKDSEGLDMAHTEGKFFDFMKTLKPNSKYRLNITTQKDNDKSGDFIISLVGKDGKNVSKPGFDKILDIYGEKGKIQTHHWDFKTSNNPQDDISTLFLKDMSNSYVPFHISDISIIKMGSSEINEAEPKNNKQILFEAFKDSEEKIVGEHPEKILENIKFKNAAKILKDNGMDPKDVDITESGVVGMEQLPLIVSGDDCFVEPRKNIANRIEVIATIRNPKVKTDIWASIYVYSSYERHSYGEDYDGPLD